jgi:hypothetical protein
MADMKRSLNSFRAAFHLVAHCPFDPARLTLMSGNPGLERQSKWSAALDQDKIPCSENCFSLFPSGNSLFLLNREITLQAFEDARVPAALKPPNPII